MAIGHRGSPCGLRYLSNDLEAWLVRPQSRPFDAFLVQPKRLRFNEIDPMLDLVGGRLRGIELEPH